MSELRPGDKVTVTKPTSDDHFMLHMQPHAWIAEDVGGGQYTLTLLNEPQIQGQPFGPIPRNRLAKGWT